MTVRSPCQNVRSEIFPVYSEKHMAAYNFRIV
jgi:hypothetical protein